MSGSHHVRFLTSVTLTVVFLLSVPYLSVYSDLLYCKHSKLFWNGTDCYKYALHDNKSDVVLIGDSSLVFGIRPDIIQRRTGLSAFNLGLPAGAVLFYPGLLLDHYLASNQKPKMVVIYASPWTFTDNPAGLQHLMNDALRFTIRHGSLLQVLGVLSHDPSWVIRFSTLAMREQEWRHIGISQQPSEQMASDIRRGRGWLPFRNMSSPHDAPIDLRDECVLKTRPLGKPDRDKIKQVERKYAHLGINVMFYIAPVPTCDPTYQNIVMAYKGVADNHPQTLPSSDFIDDDWRTHLDVQGAIDASDQLATFLMHEGHVGKVTLGADMPR